MPTTTIPSGLGAQWCFVDEATYGVVPSLSTAKFYALDSEMVKLVKVTKQGTGLFQGSLAGRAPRRVATQYSAAGPVVMDLPERAMQQQLFRLMGSYGQAATTLTQDASTGAFKSVHALGPLAGHSFAMQAGRPDVAGTLVPFSYSGAKYADWELNATLGEIVKLNATIQARNEIALSWKDALNGSVPALAAYTAPVAGSVFRWVGGALLYGGTPSTSPLVAAPSAPAVTPAASGGTVANGTYQVVVSYVNAQGETVGSTASPVTTTGTNISVITITSPAAAPYATGWYAYVTQAAGAFATATRQQAAGSPTNIGTNLVITAPPTNTGALAQSVNTAGQLTSISAPTVAANLTGPLSFKCARGLDLNRFAPDVAPFRNEPLDNAIPGLTGSFGVEWLSAGTYLAAHQNDTATAIQLQFTTSVIGSGADVATLSLMFPVVRLDDAPVGVPGPQVLTQVIPWTVLDDGVNNIAQATYWTLDAT